MSDSLQLHGLKPTRLLHPCDFPGKSAGVGRHCLLPYDAFQCLNLYLYSLVKKLKNESPQHVLSLPVLSSIIFSELIFTGVYLINSIVCQMYSKVNQFCIYIYPKNWIEFPTLYTVSLLVIYFKYVCVYAQSLCVWLCDPVDCSPQGSSLCGIFQARIPKRIAIFFSRGSSWLRNQIHISCIGRRVIYHWATREDPHNRI